MTRVPACSGFGEGAIIDSHLLVVSSQGLSSVSEYREKEGNLSLSSSFYKAGSSIMKAPPS